jgi:hypothetical protein
MLARRLTQRGVALSSASLAAVLGQQAASASVPHSVLNSTIKVATLLATGKVAAGAISIKVAALTERVTKAMLFAKLKPALALVLMLVLVGTGAAVLCRTASGQDDKKPAAPPPADGAAKPGDNKTRLKDLVGDWRDRNSQHLSIRFSSSESVFLVDGKPSTTDGLTASYTIDWSKDPVAIDFVPANGNPRLECILKLEGDRLTLGIPLNQDPRPVDFASAGAVLQYQRIRKPAPAGDKKPALRVVVEPFLFQGSYYLKLSLENNTEQPHTLEDHDQPAWTPAKWFQVYVNGKEEMDRTEGAFSRKKGVQRKEIAAKSRAFFGVLGLAGADKAHLLDGYSPRCELAAGTYEIEIRSDGATPARLKVTIPVNIASAADQDVPAPETPLRFSLTTVDTEAGTALQIYLANESCDVHTFPYRGDTPPWHRANWYQLEIDGKAVKPDRNDFEHPDRPGQHEIQRMNQRFAHTLYLVTEKAKDRKFDYHPVYALPAGDHQVRVVASPLWMEQKLPIPAAASVSIRVHEPKE